MQQALRTGIVPERHELARLLGKNIDDIPEPDNEAANQETRSKPEDPDAEAFRARYHAMVNEKIIDWLDEHPEHGKHVPAEPRQRIEDDCRRQIQHQWAFHRRRLAEQDED
ncbi:MULTISPECIES: hypothetical protein [Mycobacterium]|nr:MULTISPECIES: hypothetical protein [Mycobacterium]MDP7707586.1 hypothetical protein [Mycobacterium sp. TY815]